MSKIESAQAWSFTITGVVPPQIRPEQMEGHVYAMLSVACPLLPYLRTQDFKLSPVLVLDPHRKQQ